MVEKYGWDQTPTPDLGLDITKAPEDIQKLYKWVIQKTYGEDVASAYAQGLVAAGIIAKNAEALSLFTSGRMDELKVFVDDMLLEMTNKDVISAPEIIASRDGEPTLNDRLTRDFGDLSDTLSSEVSRVSELTTSVSTNVLEYKHLADDDDWTLAIQTALDNHTHVLIPFRMKHTGLVVTKFGATLSGTGSYYGDSILEYEGDGVAIQVEDSVAYFRVQNLRITGIPLKSTDYYNTNSIGIDISSGNTSITVENSRIDGFDILINSNFNSFYNKFFNNRFDRFRIGLNNFNSNNLHVQYNRVLRFHTFSVVNGSGGPYSILNNSFEMFNGYLISMVGVERTLLSFLNNYIEVYDTIDLPSNFPTNTFSKPGKFGGNTLFTGNYSTMTLENNEFQIRGLYRFMTVSTINRLYSKDNYYHLYETGNNLDLLYSTPDLDSFYISDILGSPTIGSGGYTRNYNQAPLRLKDAQREGYFYDAIDNKIKIAPQKVLLLGLVNGWKVASLDYGHPRAYIDTNGIYLQGTISGVSKTGNVVANIPLNRRPVTQGTNRTKCPLSFVSGLGSGPNVAFSYNYETGDIVLEQTPPPTLENIILDGSFIPIQI